MTDTFDVKYLAINQLAYTFNKYTQLNTSNVVPQGLADVATQSLQLMKQYEAIHPIAETLLQFLSNQRIFTEDYTKEWISTTRSLNEAYLLQLDNDMKQILDQAMEILSPERAVELFAKVRRAIVITLVQSKYEEGLILLTNYLSAVDFSSQPKTREKFVENRYMEFLFYQYVLNKFSMIWFPNDDHEGRKPSSVFNLGRSNKVAITSNSYKPLNQIYVKASTYHQKNESLFSPSDNETRYFWAIKFLHLKLLFKQFKFVEFYEEFSEYCLHQKEPIDILTDDLNILRSNLLVMFGIVSIFLKPFNSLTLLGVGKDDILVDLFSENPDALEYKFYGEVMLPLAKCDFRRVKASLLDPIFVTALLASFEYNFPVSCRSTDGSAGPTFIEYLKLIIDLKNFFVILTSSREISQSKVFQLLGYDETQSPDDIRDLASTLTGVIVALDLAKYGIYYDSEREVFVNKLITDSANEIAALQENIADLQNEVQAETLATKMTDLLVEKYYS
ncbi:hypothetical protein Cantr_06421 [Candida viswanathii]|uniref:Uncharacterized protein n=1 Tax=Candida viswanathii TaxID=5486 RepID=A0A367XVH6_9ASCO|nr:hypothetical protein Cantr_06421 [Candida viswanathii]